MIKHSHADINRKLRRTRKEMAEAKKWRDIFFNLMFPLGLASSFGWVITHKIFEVCFVGRDLNQDEMRVKAIWNVAMYFIPGSAIFLSLALLVMWLLYEVVYLWCAASYRSLSRKSRGHHEHR